MNEGTLLTSNPFTNKSWKQVFLPPLELHFSNIFSLCSIFVAMHTDENLVKISCPHSSSQPSSFVTVNMSLPVSSTRPSTRQHKKRFLCIISFVKSHNA